MARPRKKIWCSMAVLCLTGLNTLLWLLSLGTLEATPTPTPPTARATPWSLAPLVRLDVPRTAGVTVHPIDAFIARRCEQKGVVPLPRADRQTLLRRLSLDLTGLPPTPEETRAFLADSAPDFYERAVERLLASPRYGERYAQHWLDVLRYADVDGSMPAEVGIYLWRSWVIDALNDDLSYNTFVGRQIAGDLTGNSTDVYATGFLARGATNASGRGVAFSAVDTIASAFLGVTLACAKCHDHFHDPLSQREYYATKALFDPLVLDEKDLASPAQKAAHEVASDSWKAKQVALQARMDKITDPYYPALFEERLKHLPANVATIYRKPKEERTKEEQSLADDYAPVVRIDARKFRDVMRRGEIEKYEALRAQLVELKRDPPVLPVFFAVRRDKKKAEQPSHILDQGDPGKRLEEVRPGVPLAELCGVDTATVDAETTVDGRRAFVSWLTHPRHPLFARVLVNRVWAWHFGAGLVSTPSDFGNIGGAPTHPELLDWLATEFVRSGYSMKALHRLIVTSQTYRRASTSSDGRVKANLARDPGNACLWRFPLRRLEAEAIRDSVLYVAGELDLAIGGRSFRAVAEVRRGSSKRELGNYDDRTRRRTLYMGRGYHVSVEMMPSFLETFDATAGRTPCARRERTVTAPQALFLLNSELSETAARALARRLLRESDGDLTAVVERGYALTLGREPSAAERNEAVAFLQGDRLAALPDGALPNGALPDGARVEAFAWMLVNLTEFSYIR